MNQKLTYKDSGVDINAGNETVENIKSLAKKTYSKDVISGIGGFSGLFQLPTGYKEPVLVASTDGVGTKLKLAFESNNHKTIGVDLVAMCVNDLICCGAKPLFFLDYFATGKLSPSQAQEIMTGIIEGCMQADCSLLGGETAELPGFYKKGEYDLAGFSVGIVEKQNIINGSSIHEEDTIIGICSSGLHSNGYSLAQKVCFEVANYNFNDKPFPLKDTIGKILLTPTFIYVELIKKLLTKFTIKGIVNITGGGLTENIPRILPSNLSCEIDLNKWGKPAIFKLIKEKGNIDTSEMLRTFNNGIGLVLIIDKQHTNNVINEIQKLNYTGMKIGSVTKGSKKVLYKGDYNA